MSIDNSLLLGGISRDPMRERREAIRDALSVRRKGMEPVPGPAAQLADRDSYQMQVKNAEKIAARRAASAILKRR